MPPKNVVPLLLLFLSLVSPYGPIQAADKGTMLWISDMHFDPFYGGQVIELANASKDGWRDHTEWSKILGKMPANKSCSPSGSDANAFLVQQVLRRAAQKLPQKPDCILITGDFLSHDFSNDYFTNNNLPNSLTTAELHNRFIDQTLAWLALTVNKSFPDVPVIAALGNNDAYCGDYDIRGNSGFLGNTRKTFRRYFLPDLSRDFEDVGGCYATKIPGTKHRFVVLNSIPFISDYPESYRITGIQKLNALCAPLRQIDPADEFDWLAKTVRESDGAQRIWLACHIPPGVACYDGTQNWPHPMTVANRTVPFVNEFRSFYVSQLDHFAGVLTGHSHAAEFKLIRGGDGSGPAVSSVLMAPSIGRNHANNASFRVLSFDRESLAVLDYTTHWLDGSKTPPVWAEPFTFTETYAQPDVSPQSLEKVFDAMKSGATAPGGKTFLDQYFFDYSTRNGARNSKSRTHYRKALNSILGP